LWCGSCVVAGRPALFRLLDLRAELLGLRGPHVAVLAVVGADHRDHVVDHSLRVVLAFHDLVEGGPDVGLAGEVMGVMQMPEDPGHPRLSRAARATSPSW